MTGEVGGANLEANMSAPRSTRAIPIGKLLVAINRALHTRLGAPFLKGDLAWRVASVARPVAMVATAGTAIDESFFGAARMKADKLIPYLKPESRVLDLGCGLGRFERFLAPHCAQIIGLDPIPGFIRRAARENADVSNAQFLVGTGSDLSGFSDATVDFLFSLGVFERLSKAAVRTYFREIHRVLAPNGRAYLEFLVSTAQRLVSEDGTIWDESIYTFWTPEEILAEAQHVGLTTESSNQEGHVLTVLLTRGQIPSLRNPKFKSPS